MKLSGIFKLTLIIAAFVCTQPGQAQSSFVDIQKSFERTAPFFNRLADSLQKQFAAKKLNWPPINMYIRSFKYDRQLEVWIQDEANGAFKFFTRYAVCAQSGTTGPKRMEGDFQVPEGFYYINEFNPNSNYHLSLGLNYPNASDRILSDSYHPGGDIYIHGNCVSVGCIPIKDGPIEELYVLATYVRASGQDFIPVHVFPVKYNEKKSMEFLAEAERRKAIDPLFAARLKEAFTIFEEKKRLPIITVNKKGEYLIF